ncbi:MAG: HAD hydrolase-like protein [Patescibacteria group bacterium]
MEKLRILCFDFDGVIVDNTLLGYQKSNQILAEIGLPPAPIDLLREHWGKRASDLAAIICRHHGRETADNIAYFIRRIREINIHANLNENLLASLRALSEAGFLIGIITSRDRAELWKHAEEIGLGLHIFDYIQTLDDYSCHKPSGDVFRPLLQWAYDLDRCLAAENIAYFGDTVKCDYQAVKNARLQGQALKFIGVCSGVNTYEEFLAAGLAEKEIVKSHNVLPLFLEKIIRNKSGFLTGLVRQALKDEKTA